MTKSEAWFAFSKLHPDRWQLYDGYCQCDLCRQYRVMFDEWYATLHPAPGEREGETNVAALGGVRPFDDHRRGMGGNPGASKI